VLENKGIKSNTSKLVDPRALLTMNGVVVAFDAVLLAVVEGILELANDVHEDVHVRGSFLGGLLASDEGELGEVGIAIVEVGAGSIQSGQDPLVGVVEGTVVVVVVLVVDVGTPGAVGVHLLHGAGGEAGDGTRVVVVNERVVAVAIFGTIDLEVSVGGEAADGVLEAGLGKSTDLALHVRVLVIGGIVLDADLGGAAGVVIEGLAGDGRAVVTLAMDLGALADGSGEGSLKDDLGVGLGVATLEVDLLGNIEGVLGTFGKLRLKGGLVTVDGILRKMKGGEDVNR